MKSGGDIDREWAKKKEDEFLASYDEHADALFRHCLVRIRDREVAKDIVQEAYSRTWLYLAEGKKVTHIRAFLYRVANNLIVDTVRKRRTSSLDALMEDEGFEPEDTDAKDPTEIPAAREAMKLLHSLDEIYQTVVTMRYIDGMSPKEIASVLGVTENVVSVRIHRGIERLSKLMKREKRQIPRV